MRALAIAGAVGGALLAGGFAIFVWRKFQRVDTAAAASADAAAQRAADPTGSLRIAKRQAAELDTVAGKSALGVTSSKPYALAKVPVIGTPIQLHTQASRVITTSAATLAKRIYPAKRP